MINCFSSDNQPSFRAVQSDSPRASDESWATIQDSLEKKFVSEDLPFKKRLEALMESYMAEHQISDDMCWDYKLMLTRRELEVCLFFIESFPETDAFDIYREIISPCLIHNMRMKIAKKGKSEGGES